MLIRIGLRRLSIIPIIKIPEKISNVASIIFPFANKIRAIGSQTIIVPTGSLGDISEVRKKMLEKNLESKLDDFFDIVPKDLFEEAQEKAFQELESDQCLSLIHI